jgi:hypothetical protein
LREILAGESATEQVNGFQVGGGNSADVVIAFHSRPVFLQNLAAGFVDLDLPAAFQARAVQAKINPADTGK